MERMNRDGENEHNWDKEWESESVCVWGKNEEKQQTW